MRRNAAKCETLGGDVTLAASGTTGARLRSIVVHALLLVAIGILVGAVFFAVRDHALLRWDDQLHLTENPFLQLGVADRYLHFWRMPYAKLYVPITYDVWAWLYAHSFDADGNFSPRLVHEASLVAHAIAAMLVYGLLMTLLARDQFDGTPMRRRLAAVVGAMIFAVHPLQVEAVAWISELRGLLAADFALLAMIVYVIERQTDVVRSARRSIAARIALATVGPALLIAATLCKPSVAALPLMLAVIDRCWLGRPLKRVFLSLVPWLAVSAVTLVLMRMLQTGGVASAVAWWRRPFVAGDALTFYAGKVVWPFDLTADYSRTPELAARHAWFWIAWVVPAIVGGVLIGWRSRAAGTAAGLFVAALLPVLGLVPFEFQRLSTVADRYAYLALLGPAFAAAIVLSRGRVSEAYGRFGSAAIVICLLSWRSVDQLNSWRDEDSLWRHAVEVNPQALVAMSNLGTALAEKGQREQAREIFDRILAIQPRHDGGHFGIAHLAVDVGDWETARQSYERAAELNPNDPATLSIALDGAGLMLVHLKRFEDAEQHYRAAIAADPNSAGAHNDLGALLLDRGRLEEARGWFNRALALMPNLTIALLNLAATYEREGNGAEADRVLRHAANVDPKDALPRKRLGRRAMDAQQWSAAIEWYQQSLAIEPTDVDTLNNLGQCQAAAGQIDGAIMTFEKAIALRPDLSTLRENLAAARTLKAQTGSSSGPSRN